MAGGGAAGLVQSGTVFTRAISTSSSGGLTNPLVSTAELVLSLVTSILAVAVPVLAVALLALLGTVIGIKAWNRLRLA
jgi:hypothetical protein